ncbi:MAG: helix-turn-helix transcriptional regulator [Oscillospiraceae bacterium]|nr:helix-turn-helix transcriptional regulator [Oscillospiraceae bacterium]
MFNENLKIARKNANLSQEKVAEIINTSRSNISKYETGDLEPNLNTLKLLCKLYKVSADELLEIKTEV